MDLGQRLFEYRKDKKMSQEEMAEQLNVTRQTISKWETNQSTPDFDKIKPLCDLFNITADELITGVKKEIEDSSIYNKEELIIRKRAIGTGISVFLYFVSMIWLLLSTTSFYINPILSFSIFILLCGIATSIMIYVCSVYRKEKVEKEESRDKKINNQINDIMAIFFTIVYFVISFITKAWHITWIIWIIFGLSVEVIKLIFMLKEDKNEK